MKLKHPPRVQATIELGPHARSPYAHWGVYEVAPDDFDDPGLMDEGLQDVDDCLDDIDTGDSPFGPFKEQLRRFLAEGRQRLQLGEASPVRINRVLPYDEDLRNRRWGDESAEYNAATYEPLDLELNVIVHLVEDDQ